MIEIAKLFFRMGMVSFGGPIAAMAMLEEEFARKRKWITVEHFSEIYAVLKLFPGPLSTQMAIYLGRKRGGAWGGIISGVAFILPAFLLLLCLSFLYVQSGGVGSSARFLGFQLGALVVILQSTLNMAKPYRKRWQAWLVCAGAFALVSPFPRYEPLVLVGFGILGAVVARGVIKSRKPATAKSVHLGILGAGAGLSAAKTTLLGKLFWTCFKAGAFVFGSGLAIVPLLEGDAVRHHHWLTHQQFMDGLALGQVTPGPVVITATFIGFVVASFPGAIIATVGIFLPAFINIYWILPRVWSRISKSPYAKPFTEFAIPAVIGAIFATTFRLAAVSLTTPAAWGIFVGGLLLAFFTKVPGWMLIVGSGLVGLLV